MAGVFAFEAIELIRSRTPLCLLRFDPLLRGLRERVEVDLRFEALLLVWACDELPRLDVFERRFAEPERDDDDAPFLDWVFVWGILSLLLGCALAYPVRRAAINGWKAGLTSRSAGCEPYDPGNVPLGLTAAGLR
jgi:hypothetical protein